MSDFPVFRPRSICFKVVEDFQSFFDWRPDRQPFDKFTVAQVPLRGRPVRAWLRRMLHCHDLENGYVPYGDLWPQGSPTADTYNFAYWRHVDLFCYFAHRRINIPTPWFINAAHENGVPVLGTVLFEAWDESPSAEKSIADFATMFSPSKGKPEQARQQLAALAAHYGFDGWLFNIEIPNLPDGVSVADVTDFLQKMRVPNQRVIWYDSITKEGWRNYQNCLNDENLVFFQACDGILTNYDLSEDRIKTSVRTAKAVGRSQVEVYTGLDVFTGGGEESILGLALITKEQYQTGVCFYAPSWTFEEAAGTGEAHHQDFEARDARLWAGIGAPAGTHSVSDYIPGLPVAVDLPFATNFDRGRGHRFAVRGQEVSQGEWSNLSLQGVPPSWTTVAPQENAPQVTIDFSDDASWDGGACLRIQGTATGTEPLVRVRLFSLLVPISGPFGIKVTFRPLRPGAGTAPAPLGVYLMASDGGKGLEVNQHTVEEGNGWYSTVFPIEGMFKDGVWLTQLDLAIRSSAFSVHGGILVGEVSIWQGSEPKAPGSVGNLQGWEIECDGESKKAVYLTWDDRVGAARFYDIWQRGAQGAWTWLMRACAKAALVETFAPAEVMTFGVQPVSPARVAQPLNAMATLQVDLSGGRFDDSGTTRLFGGHLRQLDAYFDGDAIRAFQATIQHREFTSPGSYYEGQTPKPSIPDYHTQRRLPVRGENPANLPPPACHSISLAEDEYFREMLVFIGAVPRLGGKCVTAWVLVTNKTKYTFGVPSGAGTEQTAYQAPSGKRIMAFKGTTRQVSIPNGKPETVLASLEPVYGDL